ncbi:GNAT family N-acetyltransferase [Flavobacterium sp.]|uniref:GNAT family N-acetyltransferase n=1 Tax=Flavobacterium sp. TaxID=239 RepID=UPI000EC97D49|nr:GNAT family N-acetyltransferase [Flavobacterium sp.]HCQ12899.1 N-acetyltransferase [Flavobacterium sp.]
MASSKYVINHLNPIDAKQLNQFILDNSERLKRYFPVTLSSNTTLEKSIEYIAIKNKEIEEKINFTFAIRDKNDQEIAGLMILKKIDWDKKQGEFAYCIGSQFEGKGLTSFAVAEMTKFAFDELHLKTLQIMAHKTNLGSIKVALNNGFVWQRTALNEFTPVNETPLDMELYELYNEK